MRLWKRRSAPPQVDPAPRKPDRTDEIIERGGFGSPTFFVDGSDMYFGNDRLELIKAAIDRSKAA